MAATWAVCQSPNSGLYLIVYPWIGSLSAAWGFRFNVIVLDVVVPTVTCGLWGGAMKYFYLI